MTQRGCTLRFFGAYGSDVSTVPVPRALRCFHCDAQLDAADTGVVFTRADACYASHRSCFVNGAVRDMRAQL